MGETAHQWPKVNKNDDDKSMGSFDKSIGFDYDESASVGGDLDDMIAKQNNADEFENYDNIKIKSPSLKKGPSADMQHRGTIARSKPRTTLKEVLKSVEPEKNVWAQPREEVKQERGMSRRGG